MAQYWCLRKNISKISLYFLRSPITMFELVRSPIFTHTGYYLLVILEQYVALEEHLIIYFLTSFKIILCLLKMFGSCFKIHFNYRIISWVVFLLFKYLSILKIYFLNCCTFSYRYKQIDIFSGVIKLKLMV